MIIEKKAESYIVDTEQPWAIESEQGKTVFEISTSMLIEVNE